MKLLDLFCCAGGASQGIALAGFEVVGVDVAPQPRYPFQFVQADALSYLDTADLSSFDAVHASPECKGYTDCNLSPKEKYPKLIGEVRKRLVKLNMPYVIENVMGAKNDMHANLMLCGSMFGLGVQRHRLFESNIWLWEPAPCNHRGSTIGIYGHSVWDSALPGTPRKDGRGRPDSVPLSVGRAAMGIDWMGIEELAEAIPPAYTEWIGRQLRAYLESERVA
jgi:DNA (cytosine-5)-methyltransferase 1